MRYSSIWRAMRALLFAKHRRCSLCIPRMEVRRQRCGSADWCAVLGGFCPRGCNIRWRNEVRRTARRVLCVRVPTRGVGWWWRGNWLCDHFSQSKLRMLYSHPYRLVQRDAAPVPLPWTIDHRVRVLLRKRERYGSLVPIAEDCRPH